jgi:hypothetical protein
LRIFFATCTRCCGSLLCAIEEAGISPQRTQRAQR